MFKLLIPRTDIIAKIIRIITFELIILQKKVSAEEYIEYEAKESKK